MEITANQLTSPLAEGERREQQKDKWFGGISESFFKVLVASGNLIRILRSSLRKGAGVEM